MSTVSRNPRPFVRFVGLAVLSLITIPAGAQNLPVSHGSSSGLPLMIGADSNLASELRNSPRALNARDLTDRVHAKGVPELAFVDHVLPKNVLAYIHLGEQKNSRYIVLERAGFNDAVLDAAMGLVSGWQRDHIEAKGDAKATLYRDGRYEVTWPGGHDVGTQTIRRMGSRKELMSPELLAKAEATGPRTIQGIGPARVVELK